MNLYKIWQTKNNDYDTYDSAVVAALTEEAARSIHPNEEVKGEWNDERAGGTWVQRSDVYVELIGTAAPGIVAGVIVASFNAG